MSSKNKPQIQRQLDELVRSFNSENMVESERLCREILAADPKNLVALRLLGVAARKLSPDRAQESLQILRKAIACHPSSAILYFELGNTYVQLHEPPAAYDCFQKAIELKPDFQQAYVNLSALTEEQERFSESLEWAKKAIALLPDCDLANYNAGNALRELSRLPEAVEHYQRALQHNPSFVRATWNLGVCQLLLGNYRDGWKRFESREAVGEVQFDKYTQPRWDGSSLQDKTILIHAEQGIGDEVIFASCFSDVVKLAKKTVIVCEPRLEKLFRRSFPTAVVHGWLRLKSRAPMTVPENCDVQIPAGSLLQFLRLSQESFPQRKQFLTPDANLVGQWKKRFATLGAGIKVGISWRAGGKPAERRKRSIPLAVWAEILTIPGVQFVNLQYSDAADDLATVRETLGVTIHDWEQGDPLIDMDEYAAKIAALDLIISVGNATVHMAGAVGTPVYAMLPRIPSWRWMAHGDFSPWYQTVRLFRQAEKGKWDDVLGDVAKMLDEKTGVKTVVDLAHNSRPSSSKAGGTPAKDSAATPFNWLSVSDVSHQGAEQQLPILAAEGEAATATGDYVRAEAAYRQVLQLHPRHAVALFGLGVVARATGRSDLAIRSFQRSLAMYEPLSDHHFQLGRALYEAGRLDAAERSLRRAFELDSHCGEALNVLGILYFDDQRIEEAEETLRAAIKLQPHLAAAYSSLGRVLLETGRVSQAIEAFQTALGCNANLFESLLYLGIAYHSQGQTLAAIRTLEKTLQLYPNSVQALHCLATVQQERGQFEEALTNFDNAIGRQPDFATAHFGRAQVLLQLGEWSLGWQEYEWRWKVSRASNQRSIFTQPQWDGSPLARRTILIHGEQGIGEELLFATCYPDVIRQSRQTMITCDPRLTTLFARSFPNAVVHGIARGRENTWKTPTNLRFETQIAAGSLPGRLRTSPGDFHKSTTAQSSKPQPLLIPDAEKVTAWRERLKSLGNGLKIGIAWRGGNSPEDRRLRWISLTELRRLLNVPGTQFISLQHGNVDQELDDARQQGIPVFTLAELQPKNHTPHSSPLTSPDLDDLAAAVAACDLVISVGNATVHLAGALGVPTWCLLSKFGGWRWLANGDSDRTPWFDSVRLFRQERLGDWSGMLVTVGEELLTFAGCATDFQEKQRTPLISPPKPHWSGETAIRR